MRRQGAGDAEVAAAFLVESGEPGVVVTRWWPRSSKPLCRFSEATGGVDPHPCPPGVVCDWIEAYALVSERVRPLGYTALFRNDGGSHAVLAVKGVIDPPASRIWVN